MKFIRKLFAVGYSVVTVLFTLCALCLIVFAGIEMWHAVGPGNNLTLRERFNIILEVIGLLTISVAALELGQTVLEEEIQRESPMSTPTRARRFLSRFMIVIVVSLAIEFLIVVFNLVHEDPARLPQAAAIGFGAAALLAAWGLFVRLNKSAEELEPEAMAQVKQEDREVEQTKNEE